MVSPPPPPQQKQQRRLKREECHRTKHDPIFSNWQVLVGQSDWENYSLGKSGCERYRIHNLPVSSCPGIYELGVAAATTDKGRASRKLNGTQIIVVYIGQADNVRARLQHYGRAGSHLDHGSSITFTNKLDTLQKGPGLFKEIFSRGFSIVYRWAPMKTKREAETAEGLLLGVFDYAWNRVANGSCRRDDIILKLEDIRPVVNPFALVLRRLQFFKTNAFNRKRVGIKIESGEALERVTKLCIDIRDPNHKQENASNSGVCGVIMADGSACEKQPVEGRKRCIDHRGMRIKSRTSVSASKETACYSKSMSQPKGSGSNPHATTICGVKLEDGSICSEVPSSGRKRCQLHKGRRITKL